MGMEITEQLHGVVPTHIFLQAGVGAMAGAMTGFFSNYFGENMPKLIIVEPDKADCLYHTAKANDGKLHVVEGNLNSIMAGLCCGEVCTVGWKVLRHHADYFFSCPDYVAADGMRVLGNPLPDDAAVISGESGAVTSGLVYNLMTDTDRENYRHVVWEGWYKNPTSNH